MKIPKKIPHIQTWHLARQNIYILCNTFFFSKTRYISSQKFLSQCAKLTGISYQNQRYKCPTAHCLTLQLIIWLETLSSDISHATKGDDIDIRATDLCEYRWPFNHHLNHSLSSQLYLGSIMVDTRRKLLHRHSAYTHNQVRQARIKTDTLKTHITSIFLYP